MAQQLRHFAIGRAALALAFATGALAGAHAATVNRSMESVHQPVVSRTDYVIDVQASPNGLAPGEADRLTGWFDGLNLGYGDTVAIDDPSGWRGGGGARDAVAAVVARYGMLVSHEPAPVTAGHPDAGTMRIVVSRAVAHVEGCPDWSHGNFSEYSGASMSNFGCASANNLAQMIANPQDLIEGRTGDRSGDAMLSVKAIKTFRDAAATGAGPLKQESTKTGSN